MKHREKLRPKSALNENLESVKPHKSNLILVDADTSHTNYGDT